MKKLIFAVLILICIIPSVSFGADAKASADATVTPATGDLIIGLQGGTANKNFAMDSFVTVSGAITDEQLVCWETTDGTTKAKSCGAKTTYTEPAALQTICRTGAAATGACTYAPVIDDPDNFAANFTGMNLYGGTFIANAAGTIVLPNPAIDMNFTIVLEGANAVVIDPLGTGTADAIVMNGLAAADDENITSSTSGARCVFQYRSADHWMATCNGFVEATPP